MNIQDVNVQQAISHAAITAAPVFVVNNWTWGRTAPNPPDYMQIRAEIERLVKSILEKDITEVSCGRIAVSRDADQLDIRLDLAHVFS